jgi:hypothetical protein
MLIIISPLLHIHVSSPVLLRFAVAMPRQHIITSSVFKLGVSFLTLLLAGCRVSFVEAGSRILEVRTKLLRETMKNHCQDSRFLGGDLNMGLGVNRTGVISLQY